MPCRDRGLGRGVLLTLPDAGMNPLPPSRPQPQTPAAWGRELPEDVAATATCARQSGVAVKAGLEDELPDLEPPAQTATVGPRPS